MNQETDLTTYDRFSRLHTLCRVYYEEFDNPVGGSLHIVLDDGNMDIHNVEFCIAVAEKRSDHLGVAIGRLLLELTEDERDEFYERGVCLDG